MKNRKPKYISKIGVDKPKNGSRRKWAKLIPKKVFFNYLKRENKKYLNPVNIIIMLVKFNTKIDISFMPLSGNNHLVY